MDILKQNFKPGYGFFKLYYCMDPDHDNQISGLQMTLKNFENEADEEL